jgi:hypothetical protein
MAAFPRSAVVNTKSGQVIRVPNTLKAKLGGRFSIDPDAIKRAEAALQGLSGQFGEWLQDELKKLDAARAAVTAEGMNTETAGALYTSAHDLKGLGTTYGYPLVSRIAASLCKLMDEPATRPSAPLFLVDSHIHAIKAVVRDEIKDPDHPVGQALVRELETRVNQHLL